jgi:flagella basal body P-ring formation protein FlgA
MTLRFALRAVGLALFAAVIFAAVVAAAAETTVSLHRNVTVTENVVRLSDIFGGIDPAADVELFYAPELGRQVALDYRWLARVAKAYELAWRPSSRLDRAIVERPSQRLDRQRILETLADGLAADGVDREVEIELDGRRLEIHVAADKPALATLETLNVDRRHRRFVAVLTAPPDDPTAVRFTVTGRFYPLLRVPVLVRPVARGDVIHRRDVDWVQVREHRLRADVATTLEQVLGLSPRRPVRAGQPLRTADLLPPVLVAKGSLVLITLRRGNMTLTAKGRALDSGARGDVVRLRNVHSQKLLEAQVTGPAQVEIADPPAVASK